MIFLPSSYEWDTIYIHLWKPKSSWRAIWKRPRPEGHVLPLLVARACELLPHLWRARTRMFHRDLQAIISLSIWHRTPKVWCLEGAFVVFGYHRFAEGPCWVRTWQRKKQEWIDVNALNLFLLVLYEGLPDQVSLVPKISFELVSD